MSETPQAALRVALMARDCERGEFRALLEDEGVNVVVDRGLDGPLTGDWQGAEVLLVDMERHPERGQVERLLQHSPLPVLLNTGGVGSSVTWHRRLVGKLQSLAERPIPNMREPALRARPDLYLVPSATDNAPQAHWLVVLGASIGGPKAVARFLQALPPDLPVTFLLAQHISASLQVLLAEQLDRCSRWPVGLLGDSQGLEPGQVWLVPSQCRIELDDKGVVRLGDHPWESAQRPDIDAVLTMAARAFGAHSGAILFSGLGKDGVRGCAAINHQGGFVWAQSAESCVIANMPDAARRSCSVEVSGSPEELADALAARCQATQVTLN